MATVMQAASGLSSRTQAARPLRAARATPARAARAQVVASAGAGEVPDMNKRNTMNLLMWGAIGLPATTMAVPYLSFFVPPKVGGGGGGAPARDATGAAVKSKKWLSTHTAGARELTEGLKGDATYLVVLENGSLADYGVNAVCTHLGCVVPWNAAENKFKCPCHGSQYDFQGKVVRGPAPLSLALAHVNVAEDDTVLFSPWTETDFRTGLQPWWH